MPQLRHVLFSKLEIPDRPIGHKDGQDAIVLEYLQTLLYIYNFRYSEQVVKRIPNIKTLKVCYEEASPANYCLNNLGHLHKLESLCLGVHCLSAENMRSHLVPNLTFPNSLKKLTLQFTHLHWEDLTTKIGSLPLLEVLKLRLDAFIGPEWETIEGQFCSLRFLLIDQLCDLEYWTMEDTHFPRLEHLVLKGLKKLREIPLSIGHIPTLQSIKLQGCGDSAINSAKRIQEEQEELGNEDLKFSTEYEYKLKSGTN